MLDAIAIGREAAVRAEQRPGPPRRRTGARSRRSRPAIDDLAVRRLERLVGDDGRMTIAQARGRFAGREVVARLIGQQRRRRIEHADVDAAAPRRSARARQSAASTPCAANMPDTMSVMATPRRYGGPSASPVMLISPPSACITASYPGFVAPRSGLAVAGNRAVDEPRDTARVSVGRAEPDGVERARAEVLDHHVRARQKPLEDRRGLRRCLKSSVRLSLLRLMLRKYALSCADERRSPVTRVVAADRDARS